jgi:hypothetical protein
MESVDRAKPDELARRTTKRKATVSWAAAVDHRLDQLVARAEGTEPERSDLLAALVASAPHSGEELDALVTRWRRQKVRDVVLDVAPSASVVKLPRHGPGRRGRR